MKKKKFILASLLIIFGCALGEIRVYATELSDNATIGDIQDTIRSTNDIEIFNEADFDLNLSLSEAHNLISEDNNFDLLSSEYIDLLQKVFSEEVKFSNNDTTNIMLREYSSIYLDRIASMIPINSYNSDVRDYLLTEANNLLDKTFFEIRKENDNLILSIDINNSKISPFSNKSVGFNVSKATDYARTWSHRLNGMYPSYKNDCTNFASQITRYAGKDLRPNPNASGLAWTYYGTVATKSWTWAHQFVTFWSADGVSARGFSNKNETQKYAKEGDFIAYWNKNTNQFSHIAYISKKSNGKIYVTQHSGSRKDDKWENINTSDFSSFLILRF